MIRNGFLLAFLLIFNALLAQSPLTQSEKKQVIDSLSHYLKTRYVDPETGLRLSQFIDQQNRIGVYLSIDKPSALADTLTQQLFRMSQDRHFSVQFDPGWVADSRTVESPENELALRRKRADRLRPTNYGFRELKILGGNIGYLKLTDFADPISATPTAIAAMNTLANTDALIIDIRANGGGFKESVDLLSSFFLQDKTALPGLAGGRLRNIPLYLLIGRHTYSAAEGFAQQMQLQKRATLIGENSGGAAHGIERYALGDRFFIVMPHTKPTPDWEGVGITPTILTKPADAYSVAIIQALKEMKKRNPTQAADYNWLLQQEEVAEQILKPEMLNTYSGQYGSATILCEKGQLLYQRPGDLAYTLLPITSDLFRFLATDDLRIQFMKENEKVTGIKVLYRDGTSKILTRVK